MKNNLVKKLFKGKKLISLLTFLNLFFQKIEKFEISSILKKKNILICSTTYKKIYGKLIGGLINDFWIKK